VLNAAEHEPGSQKDAFLIEHHPDLVVEGLLIAAAVLAAGKAFIVVDGTQPSLGQALESELDSIRAHLGELPVPRIVVGPRDYLLGEETALLEVVEGRPPRPRFRPPFPTERGWFGYPTVVNNVETLANCAAVLRDVGAGRRVAVADTFLWTVWDGSGQSVVGESRFGVTVGDVLQAAGFHLARATTLGGFSGGVVGIEDFDLPVEPEHLATRGLSLGSASFRVVGYLECIGALAEEVIGFFAQASCGQCGPCHLGLHDAHLLLSGRSEMTKVPATINEFEDILRELEGRCVCRLPDGASITGRSLWRLFSAELCAHAAGECLCQDGSSHGEDRSHSDIVPRTWAMRSHCA
jgi:NADH-quinone oxidoreductase subunit F